MIILLLPHLIVVKYVLCNKLLYFSQDVEDVIISKMNLLLLVGLATLLVLGYTEGDSDHFKRLFTSPDITSVLYANFHVKIYQHPDNENRAHKDKRYFYGPVALLDHKSATSSFNPVIKRAEMRFRVQLRNDEVESSVILHLSNLTGEKISSYQVQLLPLDKVILVSTSTSPVYSVTNDWLLPYHQEEYLLFTLTCANIVKCEELAKIMRTRPEMFHDLRLLFSWSWQTTKTKQITIRSENVVNGNTISKLLKNFPNEKEVALTAKDEEQLLSETTTHILNENFRLSDVIFPGMKSEVYKVLQGVLFPSKPDKNSKLPTVVESDGAIFKLKPPSLSRISLETLRGGRNLEEKNVTIRYTPAVFSTRIHVGGMEASGNRTKISEILTELETIGIKKITSK